MAPKALTVGAKSRCGHGGKGEYLRRRRLPSDPRLRLCCSHRAIRQTPDYPRGEDLSHIFHAPNHIFSWPADHNYRIVFAAFPEKEPDVGPFGTANLRTPGKALPAGTQNLQRKQGIVKGLCPEKHKSLSLVSRSDLFRLSTCLPFRRCPIVAKCCPRDARRACRLAAGRGN